MSKITVLSNECVDLFYHEDTKIIHHIYKTPIGGDCLKEELNTGIDLLRKHGASKWLSDNRAIDSHTPEETDWINNDWLPRAIENGWKYWALVVPDNTYARYNMFEFTQAFHKMGVRAMVFVDPDTAMDWLIKIE